MKKILLIQLAVISLLFSVTGYTKPLTNAQINAKAQSLLKAMSLKERIGQKLMLDFRYWCETKPQAGQACTQDFVTMTAGVKQIINENHIGGVILFANNLKDVPQIVTLTDSLQQSMREGKKFPLLIGTDQEGGIVARLPRNVSVTFPGNMAMAAAYLGNPNQNVVADAGKVIALDLKAVGINVDFAPDVDVNVNPLNPIINVRSFSDDPTLVAKLGADFSQALQAEDIASTLKHFPGHGDTVTDSHLGLPVVNHNEAQAWSIDLYPFKKIIAEHSPDLIMTAHIQYPALDSSKIYAAKAGQEIITPATLSRTIQFDLLRNKLNYQGVVITDALDMGAIAQNFDPADATIKAFIAGVDIALMPITVTQSEDAGQVAQLVAKVEAAVKDGTISERELNESVLRILRLKIKLGLFVPDHRSVTEKISQATKVLTDPYQHDLESQISDEAMTLVQNKNQLVPIKLFPGMRIHILTPWGEQGAGIAAEIKRLQAANLLPSPIEVTFKKMAETDLISEQQAIDNADIVIVGGSTTKSEPVTSSYHLGMTTLAVGPTGTLVFPDLPLGDDKRFISLSNAYKQSSQNLSDAAFAFQALQYAKKNGKKTVFLSFLAPYDLPNYRDVADSMLAGYDYYGYLGNDDQGYFRGPSMPALTRILFGLSHASAKLPLDVSDPLEASKVVYPRGFGLN